MSFLTGFALSNNLIENKQDRQAIQNLFPNLGGISDDVALLSNNLRNESILEIKNTEIFESNNFIKITNTVLEFPTRSNVFSNRDIVDVFYNNTKQNSVQLSIINSNSVDKFSLSQDGINALDLTPYKNLGGNIEIRRNDSVFLSNFLFTGISDLDYISINDLSADAYITFESVNNPSSVLPLMFSELDFTTRSRKIKFRQDGSLTLDVKLEAQGSFISKGDVSNSEDIPGLYITDATSPADSIVAIRAFSNDNNPWSVDGSDLVTQASTVTIGNLVFDQKIEINGVNVNTEFGPISGKFTHKLPITIDGQTFFICLNKPD
jgi:hypothetical protein